jgi:hypothetical protein
MAARTKSAAWWLWHILAAITGTLIAVVTWLWLSGPLWSSPPGMARFGSSLEGFSPDGRILVTCSRNTYEPVGMPLECMDRRTSQSGGFSLQRG